ncbi:S-adenosylhomocysteine deaminase [Halobacteriales archaeon QS_3_64_16]|nr:MAG: S-adenosylhomocysteine deaminase [Halobacteriales archaeon QS_3_64_16]
MTTLRIAGGRYLTPEMVVETGDVLVDRGTGKIISVGEVEDGEETLDATGCVVMPGLVNAHTHAAMTLLRGYADDEPLESWLREHVWPAEAQLTAEDIRAGTDLALCEMIRSGTTAFCDMYFEEPAVAAAVEEAGLRALLGHGIVTVGKDEEGVAAELEEGLGFAREYRNASTEESVEGESWVRTACMPHSLTTVAEDAIEECVAAAKDLDVPIHYHANETEGEVEPIVSERGIRPLEYADDRGLLGDRALLAHGVHLDDREISLLAERGTGVVHCPASNMKLASGMAPIQDLLDAGVTVGLGTDGAASNNDLDLFDELRDAAMVGKVAADDASAVAAPDVLEMATRGGAELLGFDSGRIEPGRSADLAVVDFSASHLTPVHDLVSHLVYAARGSDVRHTICNGEVLMRDRELTTLDEDAIRTEAQKRAMGLAKRAESG